MTTTVPAEGEKGQPEPRGWQAEKRHDQRKYHYIVGSRSLCLKLGFYTGELMAELQPLNDKPGKEDCAECHRRLKRLPPPQPDRGGEER